MWNSSGSFPYIPAHAQANKLYWTRVIIVGVGVRITVIVMFRVEVIISLNYHTISIMITITIIFYVAFHIGYLNDFVLKWCNDFHWFNV